MLVPQGRRQFVGEFVMSSSSQEPRWQPVEPGKLSRVAVVAHCLDNQWVPKQMLEQMTREGLSLEDVRATRSGYVRAEYLRALLTAQQVIVNRVFFYNNDIVSRDYMRHGSSRDAFASLLRTNAIVPHLHSEDSPFQIPANMDLVREGFDAWVDVCKQAEKFSVSRLSWKPERNKILTAKLGLAFQEFVLNVAGRAAGGGAAEFARHLGLPKEAADDFRKRLRKLRTWANRFVEESEDDPSAGPVTRNAVYKEFVTPPGVDPTSGRCDGDKPYSSEIKQLVDLQYNTALPEFLDRLPMRPVNTLHRAALRENLPQRPGLEDMDQAALADVLRSRLAFDNLVDNLDPFNTASLLSLDLPSIVKIRETDAWRIYTTKLAGLVSEPLLFEARADAVLEAYQELLRVMAEHRSTLSWKTVRQSHLEISGVSLEVTFSRHPVFQQIGEITGEPAPCQATVRIAMVNKLARNRANPDLVFDTLHAQIDDPRAYLDQVKRTLRQDGFRERRSRPRPFGRRGGMEQDREPG
jgi:hypothetical protein